jgi:hypothetical protein
VFVNCKSALDHGLDAASMRHRAACLPTFAGAVPPILANPARDVTPGLAKPAADAIIHRASDDVPIAVDLARRTAERTGFPNEMVEVALAHAIDNKVEAAYRRGDLFDKTLSSTWTRFSSGIQRRRPSRRSDSIKQGPALPTGDSTPHEAIVGVLGSLLRMPRPAIGFLQMQQREPAILRR